MSRLFKSSATDGKTKHSNRSSAENRQALGETTYDRMKNDLDKLTERLQNRRKFKSDIIESLAKNRPESNLTANMTSCNKQNALNQQKESLHIANSSISAAPSQQNTFTNRTFQKTKNQRQKGSQSRDVIDMLVEQNQKLTDKVGELESKWQALNKNLSFLELKYEAQFSQLESRLYEERKQRVYYQKLADYYKIKAHQYIEILSENGIQVYGGNMDTQFEQQLS